MRSPMSDIIPSAPHLPSGSLQNGSPHLNSQRPKQHHNSQDNNGNINQQFQRQSVAYNSEQGDQGTAQFIKTNTVIATNVFKDTYSNSNSIHNNNNNNNNTNNNTNNNIWISSNLGQVREESLERSGLLQVLQTRRISEKKRSLQQHAFDASMYRSVHFMPFYLLLLSIDSVVLFVQSDNDTSSYETYAVIFLVALLITVGIIFLIVSHKYQIQLKQKLLQFQKYLLVLSIMTQSAYVELFMLCLQKNNSEIDENKLTSVRILNVCLLNWLFCTISQSQLVSSSVKILLIVHISLRFIFIPKNNDLLIYHNISEIVLLAMYSGYQFLNIYLILKITYNNRRNPHRLSSANNIQKDKGIQMLPNDDLTDNPKHYTSIHQNNTNSNNINGSLPMTLSNLPLINKLSSKHHQENQSNLLNLQASNHLLQPVSYNSLNGSMEKPPIESTQALVNSKRPPLFFTNLGQDPIPQTIGGDNERYRSQFPSNSKMPNIPESDPENEFSKQAGSLIREQNKQGSSSMTNILSNRYQPHYNTPQSSLSNNQSSTIEQKALIDQLIEVDGVLVFEQDTQSLVYANQNILNLLETDQANVLDELQQLKHLTEEKTNSKDVDSFNSNLLKPSFKNDSGGTLMANSTPVVGLQNGNQKSSKMNSNPILNQVIEEDENEQDFCNIHKDKRFKHEAESPQFPHHKHTHTNSNSQHIQSNPNENSDNIGQQNNNIENNSSKIINENMNEGKNPSSFEKYSKKQVQINQSNLTIPHIKKKENAKLQQQQQQQQSYLSKGINNNSSYSMHPLGSFEALADEQLGEDGNPLKSQTKKTESIFKPFFNSQATSPHSYNQQQQQQYSNIYMSDFLNQTPQQDQYNQGKYIEPQELQFPSFLSSIVNLTRKNTNHTNPLNNNNYGSITTLERERGNSTLKEFMEDVRSKSGTLFQQRKSLNIGTKKTLHTRRQQQFMSYSSMPEVIIGNMILYKEDSSRLFLAKYSMIEHAGKILHIVTIRDLSNDVFEMILERQSNQLIEELYFHLNLAGISGILNRAFIQLKESKRGMDKQDYIRIVRPLRIHLRLFASLLGDVFDVRYLQLKTFHLNIDYFDLSSELNRARKTTELLRPDILLSSYVDKSIPVQILNDRARVSQILQNLLVNTCRVLNGTKIFLRAKLCSTNESLIKIVIQNREIEKTQKEAILKAFNNQNNIPDTNPLGYHLFVCNLLARHVSNHKKSLQLLTNNPQYLKFKFYIYLFNSPSNTTTTNANHANNIDGMYQGSSKQAHSSTSASQLSVTPRQFSINQQANLQQYNIDVKQSSSKNYLNSLSHFDDERFEMANQLSARNEKKEEINDIQKKQEQESGDQQKEMQKIDNQGQGKLQQTTEGAVIGDNLIKNDSENDCVDGGGEIEEQVGNQLKQLGSSNSLFSGDTELSENLHSIKLKDIDEMQLQMPIKSIGDLPPFRAGYSHSKEQL